MTYLDYITKTLAKFDVSVDDVNLIILNENLLATDEVDIQKAKLAIYNQMSIIIPVIEASEGNYSKKINLEGVKMWFSALAKELKKPNPIGLIVKNSSNRW